MFSLLISRVVRKCAVLGLCALGVSSLVAQMPDPESGLPDRSYPFLKELLDKSVEQSPRMIGRNIALARAEAERIQGASRSLPSLYLNGRYGYEKMSVNGTASTDGFGTYYTLGLSQPLYHWGAISAERELGKLSVLIAEKAYAEVYKDLASTVRIQFLRLIQAKKSIKIRREALAERERNYRELETRRANGRASDAELWDTRLQNSEISHSLDVALFEFEQARNALARLCGLSSISEDQIPDELVTPSLAPDEAAKLVTFFDQSDKVKELPSVVTQNYVLRQNELRYRVAKVRLLPKFDLSASTGVENQPYLSGNAVNSQATNRTSISLSANWQIFDGFATRAAKMQALAGIREANEGMKTLMQDLDEKRRTLATRFALSTKSLSFAEEHLTRHRGALSDIEENVRSGRMPQSAIEQYRTVLANLEVQAMSARIDTYSCWNELLSMLWLDPALQRIPAKYLSNGNSRQISIP